MVSLRLSSCGKLFEVIQLIHNSSYNPHIIQISNLYYPNLLPEVW